jgi:hypothetical protein
MTPRIFNVLLGMWLFFSGFAWRYSRATVGITVVCGLLTAVLAVSMLYFRFARYLNVLVAVVLLVSSVVMISPQSPLYWNNAVCALAIFVASLVGRAGPEYRPDREIYGHA